MGNDPVTETGNRSEAGSCFDAEASQGHLVMRLHSGWSLSAPLGVLTTLACVMFLSSLLIGAKRIDDAERARELTLIERGAPQRVNEVAAMLNPFVTWEDALVKLEDFKDKAWADKNLGTSTRESPMFQRAVALDPDDRVVYASDKTGSRDVDAFPGLMSVARPLVARVRAIEAHPALAVRTDHTPRANRPWSTASPCSSASSWSSPTAASGPDASATRSWSCRRA